MHDVWDAVPINIYLYKALITGPGIGIHGLQIHTPLSGLDMGMADRDMVMADRDMVVDMDMEINIELSRVTN